MQKKILLIDDDPGVQKVTVPILTKAGFEVFSATTGEQGFQLALDLKPNLILLDVILPGIKGRELCVKMKAYPVLKHIPIVFFTALDSDDAMEAGLKLGAAGHLIKPVNPASLVETINKYIG